VSFFWGGWRRKEGVFFSVKEGTLAQKISREKIREKKAISPGTAYRWEQAPILLGNKCPNTLLTATKKSPFLSLGDNKHVVEPKEVRRKKLAVARGIDNPHGRQRGRNFLLFSDDQGIWTRVSKKKLSVSARGLKPGLIKKLEGNTKRKRIEK